MGVTVEELYGATFDNELLLQFNTEQQYEKYVEKLRNGVIWGNLQKTVFGWPAQDKLSSIRITGYSSQVIPIPTILRKFSEYGEVVTWKEGFLRELPQVRDFSLNLKMKIKPGTIIPSILNVKSMGERLKVYSDFSEKVCFKCNRRGHIAPYCRNKPASVEQREKSRTWADIVMTDNVPVPSTTPSTTASITPSTTLSSIPSTIPSTILSTIPSTIPSISTSTESSTISSSTPSSLLVTTTSTSVVKGSVVSSGEGIKRKQHTQLHPVEDKVRKPVVPNLTGIRPKNKRERKLTH